MAMHDSVLSPSESLPQLGVASGLRFATGIFFGLLLLLVLGSDAKINQAGCGVAEPMGRIIGGESVRKRQQLPWVVELQIHIPGWAFTCGGSIITKNVILTAAHCLYKLHGTNYIPDRVEVYYNATQHVKGPRVDAKWMMIHPKYTPVTMYDVALLKLPKRLQFDAFVKPICLPVRKIPVAGKKLVAAGWGQTGKKVARGRLLHVTLDALEDKVCKGITKRAVYGNVTPEFGPAICTSSYGKGTCVGDSGGPVSLLGVNGKSVQVGVVGAGTECKAGAMMTKIFPRVSEYMPWIKKALRRPKAWKPLRAGKNND
ncbi:chymotrypsin-2-like [Amblyomma americanum]